MKSKMYYGSIDLSKIDESKVLTNDKNGNPFQNGGRFLNVTIWVNDEPDQFGNHVSIKQNLSKEEREAGKKIYLGNFKLNQQ